MWGVTGTALAKAQRNQERMQSKLATKWEKPTHNWETHKLLHVLKMSWKLFYAAKKLFSECPPAQVSPYSSVPPWRTRPPRPPICPPAPRGGSTWPAWHSRFATHPNINLLVTDIHIPCFVFFPPAPFIPYLYHIYAILVIIHFPFIFHKFRSNIPIGFFPYD